MLAAALLNYADDEGFFNANPALIKAECSPLREPAVSIPDSLARLVEVGYLRLGTATDGRRYGAIVTFNAHQVISRPKASKISGMQIVWDRSMTAPGSLQDRSAPEGNREQGSGTGNGTGKGDAVASGRYEFEGKIIKLTPRDFLAWQRAYPFCVPDLAALLQSRDDWLATDAEPRVRARWYPSTSNYLAKLNRERAQQTKSGWNPAKPATKNQMAG